MKTIYYLDNIASPGQPINENTTVDVETTLTTLGLDELTITGLSGDLLEEIQIWVPKTATGGVPNYGWIQEGIEEREWKTGDNDNGESNTGRYVQFSYILDSDRPTLDVKIRLKIVDVTSLPTNVYLETLEIGDTSSNLIFRSGVNPDEPSYSAKLSFNSDAYKFTENPIVYEEFTDEIGYFHISNSGTSNAVVQSVEFRDSNNVVKDYVFFYSEQSSYADDTATIGRNKSEKYLIKIDAQSDRVGDKFIDSFRVDTWVTEEDFILDGWIRVIYDNGDSYEKVGVEFSFQCPILEFEYDTSSFFETEIGVDPLIFNFNYMKENNSEFGKVLKLYNNGRSPLIIGDISTNFSLDGDNANIIGSIVPDDTFPITIASNSSYDFKFKLTDSEVLHVNVPYVIKEDGTYDPIIKETLNKQFDRNLMVKSNAINYNTYGIATDRNVLYDNNTGISTKQFSCSVYYDYSVSSPYSWRIMDVDSFVPSILKPLHDSIAKIDVFNSDIHSNALNSSDYFKLEIVDHNEGVGTIAWLNNELYGGQAPSTQPLFLYSPDYYEESYAKMDELATYVSVKLPEEADQNRYYKGEPEVDANIKLAGHVRRKYDFKKNVNPLKILITRVVLNSPTYEDPGVNSFPIDEDGVIDPKDGTSVYYNTNETLLLYLYGKARLLSWDSYGVLNYRNTILTDFETTNVNKYLHMIEGIRDIPSYGLLDYNSTDSIIVKDGGGVMKINISEYSYGLLNYNYTEDVSNLKDIVVGNPMGILQRGSKNSFGMLNYMYKSAIANIVDLEDGKDFGILQDQPNLRDIDAYGILHYINKLSLADSYPSGFPDGQKVNRFIRTLKIPAFPSKYSYGLLNYNYTEDVSNLKDIVVGNPMGTLKINNETPRYSYGLWNYMYKSVNETINMDHLEDGNEFGTLQYRPDLQDKESYGVFNYNNFEIGVLKGISWGGISSSGENLGILQFVDPSNTYRYSYSLMTYNNRNDISNIKGYEYYGYSKYGVNQYNPSYIYKNSYSVLNTMFTGDYEGFLSSNVSFMSSKRVAQNIQAYSIVHFNQNPFSYCLVEQSVPDFNVKTTDGMFSGGTTHDPGHSIDVGTLNLWITDSNTNFDGQNVNHLWKPSYPEYLTMSLYNNGNTTLTIHSIEIENNSPMRIYQLKVSDELIEGSSNPFPMTIDANSFRYSTFQLYVSGYAGEGVEDGYLTPNSANAIDDYYDSNTNSTHPILKIYTDDPNPDPNDSLHVIIVDPGEPYDGMAEWRIEVNWATAWAENAQT